MLGMKTIEYGGQYRCSDILPLLLSKPKKNKLAKIRSRWEYRIFVGVRRRSGEFWVALKEGGVRAVRTVRRIPEEHRWGSDNRNWVKHVPCLFLQTALNCEMWLPNTGGFQ